MSRAAESSQWGESAMERTALLARCERSVDQLIGYPGAGPFLRAHLQLRAAIHHGHLGGIREAWATAAAGAEDGSQDAITRVAASRLALCARSCAAGIEAALIVGAPLGPVLAELRAAAERAAAGEAAGRPA